MPIYNIKCKQCGQIKERKFTFEQYKQMKERELTVVCDCGGAYQIEFDPSGVGFVLKDGESGGWVSKASKENAYRANRRQVLTRRERAHVSPKKLVPNFQGQVTETWKEAKDFAYQTKYDELKGEKGIIAANDEAKKSATTYDRYVQQELNHG